MKKLFKILPLPVKLMLIGLIPLLFLLIFAAKIIQEKYRKLEGINAFKEKIHQSADVTRLISNLQFERRLSFNFIIKNQDAGALALRRAKVDSSVRFIEKNYGSALKGFKSYTFLDSLNEKRVQVDRMELRSFQALSYYTNTIFRLNTLTPISAQNLVNNREVEEDLESQRLVAEMITYFGLLRANLYSALLEATPDVTIVEQIRNNYNFYYTYHKELNIKASPFVKKRFKQIQNEGNLKRSLNFTEEFLAGKHLNQQVLPNYWWDLSNSGITELDDLLGDLVSGVESTMNKLYQEEKNDLYRNFFFLVFIITLVLFIVSLTIKNISQSLIELREAAHKIAGGATGIKLNIHLKDVVGSLAKSINHIDENNRALTTAAEAIGRGDFNVEVIPRSQDDILGHAVLQMKHDLKQFRHQNSQKIWLQTGMATITSCLQGEKTLAALTKDSLNALINYLEAEVGLFYIVNENKLFYYTGYGAPGANSIKPFLEFGETLVGQAAADQKIIRLNDLPQEYLKISSGTGSISAKHVLIVPLINTNGIVKGVIEIGALNPISEDALTLIEDVSENIATAISITTNRIRLQELFEETQSQAEELQAQHSTLENINNELKEQTHKLQSSEEELKVQQEELIQANKELAERAALLEEKNQVIVERNLEIQKKADELELSTKYKSEFLANMSHELRTPLNSILLLSRLIGENTEKNLSEDQLEYAKVIQSSGNGLLTLIDEILDLSKIEAGKIDLEYSTVYTKELVNTLQGLFNPLAKEKNLTLSVVIDPAAPATFSTDQLRLEQILKNLLANALKFTAKGFITLSITIPEERDSFICFSVKDTGVGIPKEKHKLIFEAFQQADGTTRRQFGGTGLGLSISKELAKLLGGQITLNSNLGEGTEFTVTIPQYKATGFLQEESGVSVNAVADQVDKPNESKEKLQFTDPVVSPDIKDDRYDIKTGDNVMLIVEDDTAFAKTLLKFTRQKGYKCLVAVRGDEGIEMAKQYKPSAILLDIQLPVKDGWEVMEELKSSRETRHIPVHIMSSMQVKKESLMKGAVDFIDKPVALEQMQLIFNKLETALSKNPRKVLIIEENAKHARALAYYLETFNIHTEIPANIDEGISLLQQKDVDCVILNMGIPDANAYRTLETVKQNPGLENLPIIIFTGKNLSKAEETKLKQYADSIVLKTAHSYQRILDEVGLFLHSVGEQQQEKEISNGKLGILNDVLKNKTVLIADDDVRNIFSLSKSLEKLRMKVLSATDGKEALRVLEENDDVDIILMDMMMPEMDGYETTTRIRKSQKYKHLPVLAVTAKAMLGDREKCVIAGASDYISKPVDIDQLISLMRVWLYDRNI